MLILFIVTISRFSFSFMSTAEKLFMEITGKSFSVFSFSGETGCVGFEGSGSLFIGSVLEGCFESGMISFNNSFSGGSKGEVTAAIAIHWLCDVLSAGGGNNNTLGIEAGAICEVVGDIWLGFLFL